MQWISKNYNSLHDAVNSKTGGLANDFLNPDSSYYPIQNADIMASWLRYYSSINAPFYIVGDYDADGVCGAANLYLALTEAGATNITVRLPKRMSEGFGLSSKIVDEIDYGILLTVDNGIAAIDAVKKAKEKGLVVLIIDHHQPVMQHGKVILPEADLIVDPAVDDYLLSKSDSFLTKTKFHHYCGSGLAYKIAELMVPDTIALKRISALAAIATIADVMPLIEDNRNIFKKGIKNINLGTITSGTQALVDLLQSGNIVSEDDIGFRLAPMINAPGRLYDNGAAMSLDAILSTTYSSARKKVDSLKAVNETRKEHKQTACSRAMSIIEDNCLYGINPIVIVDEQTPEGVVGLVAGQLQEDFHVSTFVFTVKDGYLKGSARGCERDNLKHALDLLNDRYPGILIKYGGHAKAAGVSVKKEKIADFARIMGDLLSEPLPPSDILEYDLEIHTKDIAEYTEKVRQYAPFGAGNPPIIFKINDFHITPQKNAFYSVLKGNSIKFCGMGCEAIGFGMFEKYAKMNYPLVIDIIGKLSYHAFLGNKTPQIEIIDFKPSNKSQIPYSSLNAAIASALQLRL